MGQPGGEDQALIQPDENDSLCLNFPLEVVVVEPVFVCPFPFASGEAVEAASILAKFYYE